MELIELTHCFATIKGNEITLLLKEHTKGLRSTREIQRRALKYLSDERFITNKMNYKLNVGLHA